VGVDRLAALLHAEFICDGAPCALCESRAARLAAAGVTVAPQPDPDRLAELRAFLEAITPFGSGDRVLSESMVDKIMDRVAAIVAAQPAPAALRAAAQAVCDEAWVNHMDLEPLWERIAALRAALEQQS
jgi:hypothetical protein